MAQIGLLVPRSTLFPSINFEFVDGLKASLTNHGISGFEIKTAGIGVGGSDKEIYSACEKMLFDGVEIIAGYINPSTAEMIQSLFESAGALFIAIDAGYNFASKDYKQSNIFTLSLDSTIACTYLPKLAAKNGTRDFAYTCTFLDSGYRTTFGFYLGLETEKSNILLNHATLLQKVDFTIEPLTAFLKANADAAVMASFSGDMLVDLFSGMEAEEEYSKHDIYVSPFGADEVWLAKAPYPGRDVTAIVSWGTALNNSENETFIAQLKKKNRAANLFSLLAWEAGILVARALEADNTTDRISILEGYTFNSPRGIVEMDKESHNSRAPLYAAAIVENEANGMCKLIPGSEIDKEEIEQSRLNLYNALANVAGGFTSWHNVYGCID